MENPFKKLERRIREENLRRNPIEFYSSTGKYTDCIYKRDSLNEASVTFVRDGEDSVICKMGKDVFPLIEKSLRFDKATDSNISVKWMETLEESARAKKSIASYSPSQHATIVDFKDICNDKMKKATVDLNDAVAFVEDKAKYLCSFDMSEGLKGNVDQFSIAYNKDLQPLLNVKNVKYYVSDVDGVDGYNNVDRKYFPISEKQAEEWRNIAQRGDKKEIKQLASNLHDYSERKINEKINTGYLGRH